MSIKTGPRSGVTKFEEQRREKTQTVKAAAGKNVRPVTVKGPLTSDFHTPAKVSHKPRAS